MTWSWFRQSGSGISPVPFMAGFEGEKLYGRDKDPLRAIPMHVNDKQNCKLAETITLMFNTKKNKS